MKKKGVLRRKWSKVEKAKNAKQLVQESPEAAQGVQDNYQVMIRRKREKNRPPPLQIGEEARVARMSSSKTPSPTKAARDHQECFILPGGDGQFRFNVQQANYAFMPKQAVVGLGGCQIRDSGAGEKGKNKKRVSLGLKTTGGLSSVALSRGSLVAQQIAMEAPQQQINNPSKFKRMSKVERPVNKPLGEKKKVGYFTTPLDHIDLDGGSSEGEEQHQRLNSSQNDQRVGVGSQNEAEKGSKLGETNTLLQKSKTLSLATFDIISQNKKLSTSELANEDWSFHTSMNNSAENLPSSYLQFNAQRASSRVQELQKRSMMSSNLSGQWRANRTRFGKGTMSKKLQESRLEDDESREITGFVHNLETEQIGLKEGRGTQDADIAFAKDLGADSPEFELQKKWADSGKLMLPSQIIEEDIESSYKDEVGESHVQLKPMGGGRAGVDTHHKEDGKEESDEEGLRNGLEEDEDQLVKNVSEEKIEREEHGSRPKITKGDGQEGGGGCEDEDSHQPRALIIIEETLSWKRDKLNNVSNNINNNNYLNIYDDEDDFIARAATSNVQIEIQEIEPISSNNAGEMEEGDPLNSISEKSKRNEIRTSNIDPRVTSPNFSPKASRKDLNFMQGGRRGPGGPLRLSPILHLIPLQGGGGMDTPPSDSPGKPPETEKRLKEMAEEVKRTGPAINAPMGLFSVVLEPLEGFGSDSRNGSRNGSRKTRKMGKRNSAHARVNHRRKNLNDSDLSFEQFLENQEKTFFKQCTTKL